MKTEFRGMTILYLYKYRELGSDILCLGVKDGDLESTVAAASLLADIELPKNAVLVPVPGHKGYAEATYFLCRELADKKNLVIFDFLRAKKRESGSYRDKSRGIYVTKEEIGTYSKYVIPECYTPVLVDNVVDTGETALASYEAICEKSKNKPIVLTIAVTNNVL